MEQYRTYLRGELRKLSNLGDATAFLAAAGAEAEQLPVVRDPAWLSQRFASQPDVDGFVGGLDAQALQDLTAWCNRWRKNNISADLAVEQRVMVVEVPVSAILLRPAEPSLRHAFERDGWLLTSIANDAEVLGAAPYAQHRPGDPVDFPICIARQEASRPGMYRVIDGMHRAIQLCRNGNATIRICLVAP